MGAWIETASSAFTEPKQPVAPHVGAWIETLTVPERIALGSVAPHVGAWIETFYLTSSDSSAKRVAPHVGAWIETLTSAAGLKLPTKSRPTWARGLKPTEKGYPVDTLFFVAPHVGAWIETQHRLIR